LIFPEVRLGPGTFNPPFERTSLRDSLASLGDAQLDYKGFPKLSKWFSIFSSSQFPDQVSLPLRGLMKKMADCGTTTGHVGHPARTLMKDARRGLNR
jgi:hypothetical protein